jgi:hypothetical protein
MSPSEWCCAVWYVFTDVPPKYSLIFLLLFVRSDTPILEVLIRTLLPFLLSVYSSTLKVAVARYSETSVTSIRLLDYTSQKTVICTDHFTLQDMKI